MTCGACGSAILYNPIHATSSPPSPLTSTTSNIFPQARKNVFRGSLLSRKVVYFGRQSSLLSRKLEKMVFGARYFPASLINLRGVACYFVGGLSDWGEHGVSGGFCLLVLGGQTCYFGAKMGGFFGEIGLNAACFLDKYQ